MTVAADVLEALRDKPAGLNDAELAALLSKRHQAVNQTCRALADRGLINREGSPGSITNRLVAGSARVPAVQIPLPAPPGDLAWAWEGNVQACVVTYLAGTGWRITSVTDTASRETGTDIIAERDGHRLLVEVKGWPSTTYPCGERAGQPKPTQPTLQAAHWFAEGLTTLIRRGSDPDARLALALPEKPRYRTLLAQAGWALDRLNIAIYLVTEDGSVQTWGREL